MEITDDEVKKKHKEFNDRVTAALNLKRSGNQNISMKLREALTRRNIRGK